MQTAREIPRKAWHSWPAYLLRYYLRQMWRDLPGPWYVKLTLIIVCQLIPGGFDEWLLIAAMRAYRAWRARRAALQTS